MKNFFLILIVFYSQLFSQYEIITSKIDELLKDDFFNSTVAGISAFNLTTNEPIIERNAKLLMRPASNMKVLTTATMLYFLGPEYKYYTGIYSDGLVKNNILYGDIYFYGNGDPSFSASDLDSLIAILKEKNISEITGNIYGDVSAYDSVFWGEGWMWDDDPETEFPYFTPLILNESSIDIKLEKSNSDGTVNISIFPESNYFKVTNNVEIVNEGKNRFIISRDWINRSNDIIVKGKINKDFNGYTRHITLFNPQDFFMYYAVERLKANEIKINSDYKFKDRPAGTNELAAIESRFGDLIIKLNKESNNLYAEAALKAIALELGGKPASSKKGAKFIDSLVTLIGLDKHSYNFSDGSGVSHYNLVSAELLNRLLNYFYINHPQLFQVLYESFPIGGIDGTLRRRMKSEKIFNNVHAKTGTLSGVSTLSGYMNAQNGDLISFSILTQNYVGSSSIAREFQDKICEIFTEINE